MIGKLWQSSVLMTWMALGVRLGGFLILLPLVLYYFSAAEVSLWLLFSAIASFQLIADFGFGPTFSREIAYGFAGRSLVELHDDSVIQSPANVEDTVSPNWSSILSATAVMLWLYRRLSLLTLLLFAVLGTWSAMGPIGLVAQPQEAWLAWIVVALTTAASIYGNAYTSFLIGANRIELQQRWEALVIGISLLVQCGALIAGTGLLGLVLVAQLGLVAQVLVNRSLALHVSDGRFGNTIDGNLDKHLLHKMWPAAWRTAIGALMAIGVSRGVAIVMANLLVASESATVLLALRIMQAIAQISQVPFYTKIPELNRLRAGKKIALLAEKAGKSMRTSLWLYVVGAILVDLSARHLFTYIDSQTQFPDHLFWLVLMLAVFTERFGAMHIQLLLTSNKAIAHVANGVTGVIWIVSLFALFPIMGALALPLSWLIAVTGFYAWYSVVSARRSMPGISFWKFEGTVALIPVILTMAWIIYIILVQGL